MSLCTPSNIVLSSVIAKAALEFAKGSTACRHILFQVSAGLKALPPPGSAPPQETSQHASDSASTATQLAKVCLTCCCPVAVLPMLLTPFVWFIPFSCDAFLLQPDVSNTLPVVLLYSGAFVLGIVSLVCHLVSSSPDHVIPFCCWLCVGQGYLDRPLGKAQAVEAALKASI